MNDSINGDLAVPVAIDTHTLDWSASPSSTVWRKRLHLVGPPEAGQVTSIVRYDENSEFPQHDHPDGEEILVLEGVFSDQQGDWPAGSYLLNPEGFRHAPFSRDGCTLLVKLRQSPGLKRSHVALDVADLPWTDEQRGVRSKLLYSQSGYTDTVKIVCWPPGYSEEILWPGGAEFFILKGEFVDEHGSHGEACWLRLPPASSHNPGTETGCTLYLKEAGFTYLKSS